MSAVNSKIDLQNFEQRKRKKKWIVRELFFFKGKELLVEVSLVRINGKIEITLYARGYSLHKSNELCMEGGKASEKKAAILFYTNSKKRTDNRKWNLNDSSCSFTPIAR